MNQQQPACTTGMLLLSTKEQMGILEDGLVVPRDTNSRSNPKDHTIHNLGVAAIVTCADGAVRIEAEDGTPGSREVAQTSWWLWIKVEMGTYGKPIHHTPHPAMQQEGISFLFSQGCK